MEKILSPIDESVYGYVNQECDESAALSSLSERDKPWDVHRSETDTVQSYYNQAVEFERYAERLQGCSGLLKFAPITAKSGKVGLKLKYAFFCRVRHCPICQWRRSLLWRARMFAMLPEVTEKYPTARWVFLTLTVRNCPIGELRNTLQSMNKAWGRLKDRKEFANVLGFVRTTEVTRGKDGTAHPHFHCLMMVRSSYFKGQSYVKQDAWRIAWQSAARLDYEPWVHVKAVKTGTTDEQLNKAVCETLKYSVKPADLVADPEWFLELTRQLFKMRFVATGGVLKGSLSSVEDADNDELLHVSSGDDEPEGEEAEEVRLAFQWQKDRKRYFFSPKYSELPGEARADGVSSTP